jgi:PAS domain S-box-containing protein
MMSVLKFLLLEDSLLDIELIEALLNESNIKCQIIPVKVQTEFESALEQGGFDLILSDYSLPGFDGITALNIAQATCPDVPFIFVTATMGEEVAIETLQRGAIDYVLKQRLERLVPAVQRALREADERRALKQAEKELYRQEQEYRALVENSPDIIFRHDKNYCTLYVCPSITEVTGLSVEHFIGKTPPEYGYSAEVYAPWMEQMQQLFKQQQRRFFEFKFDTINGTRFYDVRMVPELATDGSIETVLSTARDITEAKKAEDKLRASKEELEQLNRVKDEFLAVLSHELRSPLNAILGWSRILRNRQVDAVTQERALETIERNAKLQTQLIEDLLDVSRIIRGKLSLCHQKTDLVPAIVAAIDTMRLAAEAKQIDFKFLINEGVGSRELAIGENKEYVYTFLTSPNVPISSTAHSLFLTPQSPFLVLGDPNRLQQIVWNLLSNAIKFTPSGGKVEVLLELNEGVGSGEWGVGKEERECIYTHSVTGGANMGGETLPLRIPSTYAQITIKDTGIGIQSDFLPYVFESFRQADGSTTRRYGGLGLGLAIVRHLVELHGGYVFASSPGEGQGATFVVQIPLLKNQESKVQNSESKFSTSASNIEDSQSAENLELSGVHILVVDDDTDSRDFLDFALLDAGAETTVVDSASAAFEALLSSQFNVLVSDIGMPQEDGYSLIQRIRKLPAHKGGTIPAIALTAYASDADRDTAIAAGFQSHLPKPIAPDDLVNAIIELIGSGE